MTASNDSGNDYFDCLIEILSPGELLRSLAIEDIKKDECVPETRNKVIAGVFNNLEIMDKWGTGILRIREDSDKWNLPYSEFEERQGRFVIRFSNPDVEKIPKIDEIGLNERQLKAIGRVEKRGSITNREYQKLNNTTKRTSTRDLAGLVKNSVFRCSGKSKRELKYALILGQNVPKMPQKCPKNVPKRCVK